MSKRACWLYGDPKLSDGTLLSVVVAVWSSVKDDQGAAHEVFRFLGARGLKALDVERSGLAPVSEIMRDRGAFGLLYTALVRATDTDREILTAYHLGGWPAARDVLRARQVSDALVPPGYP